MTAKKIAIMVDEMYQVIEVWYPYYRFCEAGLEVNLIAADVSLKSQQDRLTPAIMTVWLCRADSHLILCGETLM